MAIFHFKHSYLDWRTIRYKRKNDLCFCNFSSFSQLFLLLDSCLDSTWIFQVHDMTINFSFVIFFCFFHSHDLSTPGNDACHRWPFKLKHLFSVWGLFWKVGLLVHSCLYHFCPKRELWLKSILEKWAISSQCAMRHQLRWLQSVVILGLVFLVIKEVWQVWSCSKSWCIPNYQISISFKNSSFFVAWFSKNSRNKFLNQEFYGQLLENAWLKCLFDFFKIVPLGAPRFSKDSKVEESIY